MGRIRYMKPDFFKDEDLGGIPFEARLLFAGLWTIADKNGRLEDRPIRIKAEIFPYDSVDVDKILTLLASTKTYGNGGFIKRYAVDGKSYIQITNWRKHQRPHHTEKDGEIPPCSVASNGDGKGNGDGEGDGEGECSQSDHGVKEPFSNGEVTVKRKKFIKPTLADVEKYKEQIGYYGLDSDSFLSFYESKGWMVGKNKMKCWKSAIRTWRARDPKGTSEDYCPTRAITEEEAMEIFG